MHYFILHRQALGPVAPNENVDLSSLIITVTKRNIIKDDLESQAHDQYSLFRAETHLLFLVHKKNETKEILHKNRDEEAHSVHQFFQLELSFQAALEF